MERMKTFKKGSIGIGLFRWFALTLVLISLFAFIALLKSGAWFVPAKFYPRVGHLLRVVIMYHMRFVVFVCGIKVHYLADRRPMQRIAEPFLLVANHIGYLDIIVISALLPVAFIAWIDDMTLMGHLAKTLCRVRTDVFLDFSLHSAAGMAHLNAREISHHARTIVTSHCRNGLVHEEKTRKVSAQKMQTQGVHHAFVQQYGIDHSHLTQCFLPEDEQGYDRLYRVSNG